MVPLASTATCSPSTEAPDVETKPSYSIRIQVADGALTFTKEFTLIVTNTNQVPTVANEIPDQTATVGAAFDYTLPADTFSDDGPAALTYSSAGQPAWLTFDGNTWSGTPQAVDTVGVPVTVTAGDSLLEATDSFLIRVVAAPAFSGEQPVDQRYTAAFAIATLTLPPADSSLTLTYTLHPAAGEVAANGDGTITPLPGLTFAPSTQTLSGTPTTPEITPLRYTATDVNGALASLTFTVTVSINTAPDDILLSATAIDENVAANSEVGTLSATDDTLAESLTYTLVASGDTDNDAFSINGNMLTINEAPDFEAKPNYSIRIQVADGLLVYAEAFVISVNDLNEAPTDITLSTNTIYKGTPANTVVSTLSVTDDALAGSLTYTLVEGSGDTNNGAFSINGNMLTITEAPDVETTPSYSIRIQVADGALTFTKELTLRVTNTNQVPTVANEIPDQTATVGAAFDYTLPTDTFIDGDNHQLSYSSSGQPDWLTFNADRWYGTPSAAASVVTISVTADDGNGGSETATFTITVNSAMSLPGVDNQTYTVGIAIPPLTLPQASGGTAPRTYSLTPPLPGLTFAPSTRILSGMPTVVETTPLRYTATDVNGALASLTFTVTVTNIPVVSTSLAANERINTMILSNTAQAITAATLNTVAARMNAAGRSTAAYQFGGQSSLQGLFKAHGRAMLEGTMEYERLLNGASFELPFRVADVDLDGIGNDDLDGNSDVDLDGIGDVGLDGNGDVGLVDLDGIGDVDLDGIGNDDLDGIGNDDSDGNSDVYLDGIGNDDLDGNSDVDLDGIGNDYLDGNSDVDLDGIGNDDLDGNSDVDLDGIGNGDLDDNSDVYLDGIGNDDLDDNSDVDLDGIGDDDLDDNSDVDLDGIGNDDLDDNSDVDSDGNSTDGAGTLSVWGGSEYRNLDGDVDDLDWDGEMVSVHLGVDTRLSKAVLAGAVLSWNRGRFDYHQNDSQNDSSGDYQYRTNNIHPYFGWMPHDGFNLWATIGYGQGEITLDADDDATNTTAAVSTNTTQSSMASGMKGRILRSTELLPGGVTTLNLKGDVAMVQVVVDENVNVGEGFMAQKIDSRRLRLLLSGEQQRMLTSGGVMTPSLDIGMRYDDGDGVTGSGVEWGAGLRYASGDGSLSVAGNARTFLSEGYDEWGANLVLSLSPPSGRGLSLSLRPTWGEMQSVADQLWHDGISEMNGGDAVLQRSVDGEVGYGVAASMLGKSGVLTPYTGISITDATRRLRLGGRFADGDGLSLNLEGGQENTTDGISHEVWLRGELAF